MGDSRDSRERTEMEKKGMERERKTEAENLATTIHTGAILHRWPTKTKTTTNRKFRTRTERGNYEVVIRRVNDFFCETKNEKKKC